MRKENLLALVTTEFGFLSQSPKNTSNPSTKNKQQELAESKMVRLLNFAQSLCLLALWASNIHVRVVVALSIL
jgi:hypothetical protein